MKTKKKTEKNTRKKNDKREFPRYETPGMFVTEINGDFRYTSEALNISEGGVFLKKRLMTSDSPSVLRFVSEDEGSFEILAQPLYDTITKQDESPFGTGYCFIQLNESQSESIKNFVSNFA